MKKKKYIAPMVNIIKVESTEILAGGSKDTFSLGSAFHEEGDVTTDDDDVIMTAKGHTAWDTWDD